MAKLSAHGVELERFEYATCRTAIMGDGQILRDGGSGWKLYKKLKAGVDPTEYAQRQRAKYDARPAVSLEFIRLMKDAAPLSLRWRLFAAIELMPNDPDGVWSEMDDSFNGNPVSIDECCKLCALYRAVCEQRTETTEVAH